MPAAPRGGTAAVPKALVELARELGVEFRCGVGVRQIVRGPDGRVRALVADDGEEIPVAAAVANSDTVRTHRDLIGGTPDEFGRYIASEMARWDKVAREAGLKK